MVGITLVWTNRKILWNAIPRNTGICDKAYYWVVAVIGRVAKNVNSIERRVFNCHF
jgi:hypothetical protein